MRTAPGTPTWACWAAGSVDFLVLEDLAVAKQNEWRPEQLYAVINRRYEDRRPLLVTADVGNPEALGEHIGFRTCSRILEMCEPMPFLDGDHRVRPHLKTFAWPASAAVMALLLPAAAQAQERTVETATNGTVTAELSYVKRTRGRGRFEFEEFRNFRVKTRAPASVLRPAGRRPPRAVRTPTETALTRKQVAPAT